jgi:hypothetical protein
MDIVLDQCQILCCEHISGAVIESRQCQILSWGIVPIIKCRVSMLACPTHWILDIMWGLTQCHGQKPTKSPGWYNVKCWHKGVSAFSALSNSLLFSLQCRWWNPEWMSNPWHSRWLIPAILPPGRVLRHLRENACWWGSNQRPWIRPPILKITIPMIYTLKYFTAAFL